MLQNLTFTIKNIYNFIIVFVAKKPLISKIEIWHFTITEVSPNRFIFLNIIILYFFYF